VPRPPKRPYHHGDLRRALLDSVADVIDEVGPAALSLREVARRAGVSHAAPAHHFGDKAGLLTALAVEGYGLLTDELRSAYERTGDFLEVGVAYVRFAVRHRAHFEVMFRPELYRADDPQLVAARAEAATLLYGPAARASGRRRGQERDAGIAAWSLVHGFATLLLNGNLPTAARRRPEAAARRAASYLFGGRGRRGSVDRSGLSGRAGGPAPG
jgi:AcrR family transcriptional regulator